jgi:DNA-binding transcriptional LysR family regulator
MSSIKTTAFDINITADLQKWRVFVAIAELGSLTRAALFLDSNQSLLSRQLNALERECKTRLFTRTGRGVELSEIGQRIFARVKALLADAERLEFEIRSEAHEPAGRVTVGMLPSIGFTMVGRLFVQLRERYPAISLKILEGSSGQVEEWLADARVDIAILYRYGATPTPQDHCLAMVDSYLIGPPGDRLTAGPEVSFKALQGLPFILPSAPNGLRTALDALARQEHISLEPVIEADSLPLQKSLVASERLYTVLPLHAVWSEIGEGAVQAARVVSPALQRSVSMVLTRTKAPAKAVSAVAAQIQAIVDEMARNGMWRSSLPL